MPRVKKFSDLHFFLSKKLPFLAALGMGNCFFSRKKLSAANFSTQGKIFLFAVLQFLELICNFFQINLACDRDIYRSATGTIKFPNSGVYDANLNCYFRIRVADGMKVKIEFKNTFDFQDGTFISSLRYSKNYRGYDAEG